MSKNSLETEIRVRHTKAVRMDAVMLTIPKVNMFRCVV